MDENLPIDIHYNKLLDWLISRRHCQTQWQKSILVVREKINAAIQDMPAIDKITELLTGTHIHYFHCLTIVELLKETEGNNKDIFGRYSSQKIKDWLEILKLYEKDNLYLAEAAQLLARNVNYEMPVLKKQISRCVQAQDDCARREIEYQRMSMELRDKFNNSCKQMGIEGKKIKRELFALVRNMPVTYSEIANETPALLPAIEYYTQFSDFVRGKSMGSSAVNLPLLRHVIERGNTTLYEWRTGSTPQKVEPLSEFELGLNDDDDDDVDAGDSEKKTTADEIDWGAIDLNVEDTVSTNIQGIDLEVIDAAAKECDGIDWSAVTDLGSGIELEVAGDKSCPDKALDEETVRGEDARSILDSVNTRNQFLNELYELEAFLQLRVCEMSSSSASGAVGSDILTDAVLQSAPVSIQLDQSTLQAWLSHLANVIQHLTNQRVRDLGMIRNSPRYVDRLVDGLRHTLSESDKMLSMSRLMITRRAEALAEQKDTEPKLELIRQRTKELQKQIAAEISKKYKNRKVNIMGEINTV